MGAVEQSYVDDFYDSNLNSSEEFLPYESDEDIEIRREQRAWKYEKQAPFSPLFTSPALNRMQRDVFYSQLSPTSRKRPEPPGSPPLRVPLSRSFLPAELAQKFRPKTDIIPEPKKRNGKRRSDDGIRATTSRKIAEMWGDSIEDDQMPLESTLDPTLDDSFDLLFDISGVEDGKSSGSSNSGRESAKLSSKIKKKAPAPKMRTQLSQSIEMLLNDSFEEDQDEEVRALPKRKPTKQTSSSKQKKSAAPEPKRRQKEASDDLSRRLNDQISQLKSGALGPMFHGRNRENLKNR